MRDRESKSESKTKDKCESENKGTQTQLPHICCFTPQMHTMARAGLTKAKGHELKLQLCEPLPAACQGSHEQETAIRNGARTQTQVLPLIWDVGIPSSILFKPDSCPKEVTF